MADITLQQAYQRAVSTNYLYSRNRDRWQFLMDSYLGGEDYRQGGYLQKYALESAKDYAARLQATPLDNQCRGIISLYVSFLFRESANRDLGMLKDHPMVESLMDDADLDGRSLDAFMKDVAIWTSVIVCRRLTTPLIHPNCQSCFQWYCLGFRFQLPQKT